MAHAIIRSMISDSGRSLPQRPKSGGATAIRKTEAGQRLTLGCWNNEEVTDEGGDERCPALAALDAQTWL
jgi:hypothetical protein